MSALDEMQDNPVFDAHPSPTLVLDTEFVIRAANRAYLDLAGRTSADILGLSVFEAFPDNPDDPDCDGTQNLGQSLRRVLRSGREHHMAVQRYDVTESPEGGHFVTRYWAPVNSPIVEGEEIIGILHRVDDVTELEKDLRNVLTHYRRLAQSETVTDDEARQFAESATAFVAEAQQFRGLADEVLHLRRALTSRATIDQAKGIVMSERRCNADEAYALLVSMSNETNVRLADVAAALVYQAQAPGTKREDDQSEAPNVTSLASRARDVS